MLKMSAITSKNYNDELMTLVDATTLLPIHRGDMRNTSRGERYVVTGGRAPHKPESSGKIWCTLTPFDSFAQSMQSAREAEGEAPYYAPYLTTCWAELSPAEQAEWIERGATEFYPSVIDAKWHRLDFQHAQAPETISAINAVRRKAIKAAMAKRR
jgi:hypothetical protein